MSPMNNPLAHLSTSELLQLFNLLLLPILVYIIMLERKLAAIGEWRDNVRRSLDKIDHELDAVHRRLDRFGLSHASVK